jgi:PPP family 3-phenylpropionic acid transporter
MVAAFFYALRWFIYSVADSPNVLIFAQLFHSVTFPIFLISSIHYLTKIVPIQLRATGQAAFAATFAGAGGIIGSAGGGWIMEDFGPRVLYGSGSILALSGAAAALFTYLYLIRKGSIDKGGKEFAITEP